MEEKKKGGKPNESVKADNKFDKAALSEQVRILQRMIAKNEEAMEGKDADEPEVVFSLKDVKTLCDMVLMALSCDKKPATIKGQRRPRKRKIVESSEAQCNEILGQLLDVVNEYDDVEDSGSVMLAAVYLLVAVLCEVKKNTNKLRLGREGKFDTVERVALEVLRVVGDEHGLSFYQWYNFVM